MSQRSDATDEQAGEPAAEAKADEPAVDEQNAKTEEEDLTPEVRAERAEREATEFRDKWMRAAADYQNFKRRVEQERQELARFANAALIINILPIVDDLERALGSLDARLAGLTWVEGILQIYRKFRQALESAGVSEIASQGATSTRTSTRPSRRRRRGGQGHLRGPEGLQAGRPRDPAGDGRRRQGRDFTRQRLVAGRT